MHGQSLISRQQTRYLENHQAVRTQARLLTCFVPDSLVTQALDRSSSMSMQTPSKSFERMENCEN